MNAEQVKQLKPGDRVIAAGSTLEGVVLHNGGARATIRWMRTAAADGLDVNSPLWHHIAKVFKPEAQS